MQTMMTRLAILLLSSPLHAALMLGAPARRASPQMLSQLTGARWTSPQMLSQKTGPDVSIAAREIVTSFVAATERGDAAAAMELCKDSFIYKTHRETTNSLAAAHKRLHTKVPAPSKITADFHEEGEGQFVREIVVKPVPFVTVAVRQEFDVDCPTEGECKLARAEFIKQ